MGRHNDDQFRLRLLLRSISEESPKERNIAEERDLVLRPGVLLLDQAADHHRFSVIGEDCRRDGLVGEGGGAASHYQC